MGQLEKDEHSPNIHLLFNSVGHFYSPLSSMSEPFLLSVTLPACDNQAAFRVLSLGLLNCPPLPKEVFLLRGTLFLRKKGSCVTCGKDGMFKKNTGK